MSKFHLISFLVASILTSSVSSGPIYLATKSPSYYPTKDILIPPSKDDSTVQIQELELDGGVDRLIVVGDLHGSLEYFDDLLKKIDFNPKIDRVVLAGDMTFKGPDSLGVLRRARDIGAGCVRGNHDHSLLEWKRFLRKLSPTDVASEYEFPSDLRLTQYYPIAAEMDQELYDYLESCPIILSVPKYSVYVMHAGVDPAKPLESQDPNVVMNIKNILADGTPTRGKFVGENWSVAWNAKQKKSKNPTTIVYGHQASLGLNIKEYSKGLDTGCVYGGQLTAMVFPGEQLVSVNCNRTQEAHKNNFLLQTQTES